MTDLPDNAPFLEDIYFISIQGETEYTINVQQNNFFKISFTDSLSFSDISQNTVPRNPHFFYSSGINLPLLSHPIRSSITTRKKKKKV